MNQQSCKPPRLHTLIQNKKQKQKSKHNYVKKRRNLVGLMNIYSPIFVAQQKRKRNQRQLQKSIPIYRLLLDSQRYCRFILFYFFKDCFKWDRMYREYLILLDLFYKDAGRKWRENRLAGERHLERHWFHKLSITTQHDAEDSLHTNSSHYFQFYFTAEQYISCYI